MPQLLSRLIPNWRTVTVHPTAEIAVQELVIGDGTTIGPGVVIEGRRVVIGREAWLDRYAYIGGGSCTDPGAALICGDWLHMGRQSHINTARPVSIGHEVGIGIETKVFAHGAYLAEFDGFPVTFAGCTIGDRVWLPNAWVNPGVTIGSDVVVSARSLVNRDLPAGCLAGGIPVRVLREHYYPRHLSAPERFAILDRIITEAAQIAGIPDSTVDYWPQADHWCVQCPDGDMFDVDGRTIAGPASAFGQTLKNQLRRHGMRFRYSAVDGYWQPWEPVA